MKDGAHKDAAEDRSDDDDLQAAIIRLVDAFAPLEVDLLIASSPERPLADQDSGDKAPDSGGGDQGADPQEVQDLLARLVDEETAPAPKDAFH